MELLKTVKTTTSPITITDLAATKVRGIIEGESDPELGLRVFVTGGGCSGLSYGMALDNALADDDLVFEYAGVRIIADSQTMNFVKGSEIDYVDQLMGGGFTLHNPNAVSTCACGSSFKTDADGGTPRSCGG
jgi:iron-sulfur cluster assembly protein